MLRRGEIWTSESDYGALRKEIYNKYGYGEYLEDIERIINYLEFTPKEKIIFSLLLLGCWSRESIANFLGFNRSFKVTEISYEIIGRICSFMNFTDFELLRELGRTIITTQPEKFKRELLSLLKDDADDKFIKDLERRLYKAVERVKIILKRKNIPLELKGKFNNYKFLFKDIMSDDTRDKKWIEWAKGRIHTCVKPITHLELLYYTGSTDIAYKKEIEKRLGECPHCLSILASECVIGENLLEKRLEKKTNSYLTLLINTHLSQCNICQKRLISLKGDKKWTI